MTTPLFDNAAALRWDTDVVQVVGGTPGPAGAAEIELRGGAVLQVDYAEPGMLIDYSTPTELVGGDPGLADVLGEQAAEVAESVRHAPEGTRRLHTPRTARREPPRGSLSMPGDEGNYVGQIVCLADRAHDPERPTLERAAAALDVARAASMLTDTPAIAMAARTHAELAAELLDECASELLGVAEGDPALRDVLVIDYGDLLPDAIMSALRDLDVGSDRVLAWAALGRDIPGEGDLSERDETAEGVWTVVCDAPGDAAAPRWVRVVDEDLSVLAVSPVRKGTFGYAAELLVPPHVERTDGALTVTDRPFPLSPHGIDAVAHAVRAGRQAVDLEAIGQRNRAADAWKRCAGLWERLGDHDRSRAARRFAAQVGRRSRSREVHLQGPALADLVVAAGR